MLNALRIGRSLMQTRMVSSPLDRWASTVRSGIEKKSPDSHAKVYNHDDAVTKEKFRLLLEHDFDTVLVTHGSNVLEDELTAVETLVDDVASQ